MKKTKDLGTEPNGSLLMYIKFTINTIINFKNKDLYNCVKCRQNCEFIKKKKLIINILTPIF